jgi:hypothetical protein
MTRNTEGGPRNVAIVEQASPPATEAVFRLAPNVPARTGLDRLDRAALAYLALPVVVFLVGWLKGWAGLPLAVLLVAGLRLAFSAANAGATKDRVRPAVVVAVPLLAAAWVALGGAGHLFYANFDWIVRDSVLRDLVVGHWPVGYGETGGSQLLLRAPIAYYLPAALVGKVCGLAWADPALLVWTVLGVALFFGLAVSREQRRPAIAITLLVLVFFSGMDLVGTVLRGGWLLATHLQMTDHLEWWADRFQYSSHTTQLFWVPNHALPGWIATALLLKNFDRPRFMGVLPMLVALLPLWSPLTAVGFLPLAAACWLRQLVLQRSFANVDWPALAAAAVVALASTAYLVLNAGAIRSGMTTGPGDSILFFIPHYLQFVLLEVGILWALLLFAAVRVDALLLVAGGVLILLPIVGFGPSNDLAMRGSIPSLVVVAMAAAAALTNPARAREKKVYWPIVILLLLGAPTAITEMTRSVTQPVWKPDYTHSLAPNPAGDYPPHYVTALPRDSWASRLLRPVQDVNGRQAEPAAAVGENK